MPMARSPMTELRFLVNVQFLVKTVNEPDNNWHFSRQPRLLELLATVALHVAVPTSQPFWTWVGVEPVCV